MSDPYRPGQVEVWIPGLGDPQVTIGDRTYEVDGLEITKEPGEVSEVLITLRGVTVVSHVTVPETVEGA